MDYNTLRNMDLNLLVVLDVLLDECSVTRASKRLGLTQSAASHALSRLRGTFDDPLLVRVGTKMQPTPRAEKLKKDLRSLLGSVRRFMDESEKFDAQTSKKTFSLGIQDNLMPMMGLITQSLFQLAPLANFKVRPANFKDMENLPTNEIMLIIAPMKSQLPLGLSRTYIGSLRWSVLMRKSHPASTNWGLKNWGRWPHIRVGSRTAGPDFIDKIAAEHGVNRKIKAVTSHFMMALPILQKTDLLFTSCFECEPSFMESFGLQRLQPPFPIEPIEMGIIWGSHLDKDQTRSWFHELIISELGPLLSQ